MTHTFNVARILCNTQANRIVVVIRVPHFLSIERIEDSLNGQQRNKKTTQNDKCVEEKERKGRRENVAEKLNSTSNDSETKKYQWRNARIARKK